MVGDLIDYIYINYDVCIYIYIMVHNDVSSLDRMVPN